MTNNFIQNWPAVDTEKQCKKTPKNRTFTLTTKLNTYKYSDQWTFSKFIFCMLTQNKNPIKMVF